MARRIHGEGSVTQRQDGRWQGAVSLGYDADGKRKRKTVYGKTAKEVVAKLDAIKQQLAKGTFSDTKLTVKTFLEQWCVEKERQVKPRTAAFYEYYIKTYIVPNIGGVKLRKLTPLQVQAMMNNLADAVGVSTANKCRGLLYSAMKQALRWHLIPRNPVEAVDKFKEEKSEMTIWTADEAARFLDSTQGHRLYAAFHLLMSTGLRCGELLGLHWKDIEGATLNVRRNLVYVKGKLIIQTPKTVKGARRVALSPDVMEVLGAHRQRQETERQYLGEAWQDHGLVFASEVGTPIHPRNFARTWYALQKQAEVTKVRLHDLRHLNVSIRRKNGQDAKLIADQIGHTDPAFTMRLYAHLFEEERQTAAINLKDLLGSSTPPANLN